MDGSTFASSGRLAAAPSSEMRRAASCREADPRGRHAGSSSLPRAGDHRESISHSSHSEDTLPTCPLATRPASERMRASNEEAEGSTRGPRTLIPPSTSGTSCTAMSPAEDGLLSSCVVARQEAELDQQLLQILPTVVSMSLQGARPRAAGTTSDKEIVRLLLEQGVVLTNVVFNLKAHAASEASAYEYVSKLRREQSADRMAEVDLLGSGSTEHGDPRSTPAPLAFGGWSEGQVYASGYAEPNFARMPPGYAASASGEGPADLTLPFERARAAVAEHNATQAEVQRMLAAAGPNRDALETLVQFVQNAEGPYCSVAECFCACSTTFPFLNYRRIVSRYMQHARLHLEAAATVAGFEAEWLSLVEAERAALAERTGDQCALDLSQPLAPRAAQAGSSAVGSMASANVDAEAGSKRKAPEAEPDLRHEPLAHMQDRRHEQLAQALFSSPRRDAMSVQPVDAAQGDVSALHGEGSYVQQHSERGMTCPSPHIVYAVLGQRLAADARSVDKFECLVDVAGVIDPYWVDRDYVLHRMSGGAAALARWEAQDVEQPREAASQELGASPLLASPQAVGAVTVTHLCGDRSSASGAREFLVNVSGGTEPFWLGSGRVLELTGGEEAVASFNARTGGGEARRYLRQPPSASACPTPTATYETLEDFVADDVGATASAEGDVGASSPPPPPPPLPPGGPPSPRSPLPVGPITDFASTVRALVDDFRVDPAGLLPAVCWFDYDPPPDKLSSALRRAPRTLAELYAALLHREMRRRQRMPEVKTLVLSVTEVADYLRQTGGEGRQYATVRGKFHVALMQMRNELLVQFGLLDACAEVAKRLVSASRVVPALAPVMSRIVVAGNVNVANDDVIYEVLRVIERVLLPNGDSDQIAMSQIRWHPTDAGTQVVRTAYQLLTKLEEVASYTLPDASRAEQVMQYFVAHISTARRLPGLARGTDQLSVADHVYNRFCTATGRLTYSTVAALMADVEVESSIGQSRLCFAELPNERRLVPRVPPRQPGGGGGGDRHPGSAGGGAGDAQSGGADDGLSSGMYDLELGEEASDGAGDGDAAAAGGGGDGAGGGDRTRRPEGGHVIPPRAPGLNYIDVDAAWEHAGVITIMTHRSGRAEWVPLSEIVRPPMYNMQHPDGLYGAGDVGVPCPICILLYPLAVRTQLMREFMNATRGKPSRDNPVPPDLIIAHPFDACLRFWTALEFAAKRGKIPVAICVPCDPAARKLAFERSRVEQGGA